MAVNIEQGGDRSERSLDQRSRESSSQQNYDFVCIGFGTTALALAATLADSKAEGKILFVEREKQFTWNPEHVLPEKSIGSNFLRDLTTTQNPRSEYTFVNFLVATDQLVQFTNNSKMTPSRRLMGQYFRWAADRLYRRGWVSYSQEAMQIRPVNVSGRNKVAQWTIDLRDSKTGITTPIQTKRVVLATGTRPSIIAPLATPQLEHLVLHSSSSASLLDRLNDINQTLNIAIVGTNQEAAELFHHLHEIRGSHTATMFHADPALRPEEHTPAIPDIVEKPEVAPLSLPPEVRQRLQVAEIHSSPGVDPAALSALYEAQYTQKIHEPDATKWRFQLRPLSEVVAAHPEGSPSNNKKVRLEIRNPRTGELSTTTSSFDIIISSTGYESTSDMQLLKPVAKLLDGVALTVDAEYRVNFRREVLGKGVGLWVLGSLEDLKERGDEFSCMAERAWRAGGSVVRGMRQKEEEERYSEVAVL